MSAKEEVANALLERQDISFDEARRIAGDVVDSGGSVLDAALGWAASGRFPDHPRLKDFTPAALAKEFRPSQVLTLLLQFEKDPAQALHWIRRVRAAHRLLPDVDREGTQE